MRVVAVLLSLLLVGACSDSSAPSAEPAPTATLARTPTPTPTASATPILEYRFVPNVKGARVVDAQAHLERRGFRVKVQYASFWACTPDGLVLRQDPPPRYQREVGSKVTVFANQGVDGDGCGLDLPDPAPDLQRAGDAFVEFARGGPPDPHLLRNPVDLYLGGRLVHTIPAWRAVHRNSYGWICPTSRGDAGHICPFSSVRPLMAYPGPIAVTSQSPSHPCMHARSFADTRERTVTLTADENLDCTRYFAVELAVGEDGRLLAVNVLLSEP
jgi:hypothetical protein